MSYSKAITAKKFTVKGVLFGVVGANIISFLLDTILPFLKALPTEWKIAEVGLIIGILVAIENYVKHRKD